MPEEFWDEEARREREEFRKQLVKWSLAFAALFVGVFFAFWWAGSALHFSASRVSESTRPTYRVWGVVRDAATGTPVPYADVADDPGGRGPLFHTAADGNGAYELLTLAEPHQVRFSAFGYKTQSVRVGKAWFQWMPRGSERREVALEKE